MTRLIRGLRTAAERTGERNGIASEDMREMLKMPEVSEVPGAHSIRGGINLRGRFCAMMQLREQDHRKWLLELEASVQEHRSFLMTTDPHKCAFGKWYDNYHADNAWLAALLKKVDGPHRQIHAVAADCRPS
jgi:purine-binding chemotaxis protein CheW